MLELDLRLDGELQAKVSLVGGKRLGEGTRQQWIWNAASLLEVVRL